MDVRNMPIAYVTGETEFMSLPFLINRQVMIPRPETEILVEEALSKLQSAALVIDMCTGCGNIAVSLAKYSSCVIKAVDISKSALEVAQRNAALNGVQGLISFFEGDMFAPLAQNRLEGEIDLVISNPPYVRRHEIPELACEVRDFEPHIALDGGEDGLRFYRAICRDSWKFLRPGGHLAVEVGYDQAEFVCNIFKEHFNSIKVTKDYAGIERIVIAQKRWIR